MRNFHLRANCAIHTADDEEEELVDRNLECCGRFFPFYIQWLRLQNSLFRVVSDIMFELFITLCIALNVLAMAIEHHDQPEMLGTILTFLNYVSMIDVQHHNNGVSIFLVSGSKLTTFLVGP